METISESSLRFNMQQITYCRTTTAVLTGSTAGILGLTGLLGFVLYFATAVLVSVGLLAKAGSKSSSYFPSNYRFVHDIIEIRLNLPILKLFRTLKSKKNFSAFSG